MSKKKQMSESEMFFKMINNLAKALLWFWAVMFALSVLSLLFYVFS